jgi:hypothetical protein
MSVAPEVLNAAMLAYLQTFPSGDRPAEHIERSGVVLDKQAIVCELDAVLKTAQNYLWDYPGGVPRTDEFEYQYRDYLREKHHWLNSASMARLFAFARWICWHEGLNAPEKR